MDYRTTVAALIVAVALIGSAGCSKEASITVGSKNFTEQMILGEIVAQHLEQRLGRRIRRKLNLGGTLLAHQALINGDIDLYPEYSGTALINVLKLPPASDTGGNLDRVRIEYQRRFHIEWLDPLGFNNTFAMVIRGEEQKRLGIESLSDARRHARQWTLGVGYEFQQRPDGLAGLLNAYDLRFKSSVTMDLGLLYQALENRKVDIVAVNTTDGMLAVLEAVILKDDKNYFPPYVAALAVRADALQAEPRLRPALNELAGKFSDTVMRRLNYQIDGLHLGVQEVAMKFLQDLRTSPSAP